ncbi:hypothetical protein MJO28_017366 [Puccinia striiformis f. sp. tritici]|nr:hypothetical protein MJO28_017366 [Puccinia striiformis f. sp. tritici]
MDNLCKWAMKAVKFEKALHRQKIERVTEPEELRMATNGNQAAEGSQNRNPNNELSLKPKMTTEQHLENRRRNQERKQKRIALLPPHEQQIIRERDEEKERVQLQRQLDARQRKQQIEQEKAERKRAYLERLQERPETQLEAQQRKDLEKAERQRIHLEKQQRHRLEKEQREKDKAQRRQFYQERQGQHQLEAQQRKEQQKIERQRLQQEKQEQKNLERQKLQETEEQQKLERLQSQLERQRRWKLEPRTPTPPPPYDEELNEHYYHVNQFLNCTCPTTDPLFQTGLTPKDDMQKTCKILVVGAGGLGCEILQNLALLGFGDIHVIDMDTINISNLNRQFLFQEKDIGKAKAEVAAKFIMERIPQVKVTPHYCKMQDKDDTFYMMFNMVVCGLDSVEARRWINATMVNLVDPEKPESVKPLIGGGTEGFKGQSRVILPTITSCYECSLDLVAPQTVYPLNTIVNTPRSPEHCIEWASRLEWPRVFKDKDMNKCNPDHIQWLFEQASARAKEHDISGVTWSLTRGVIQNIVPAIASTNAIIAASCCNEAFKIATSCAPHLQNYMMYNGNDSIYSHTFQHQKKPDSPVCGNQSVQILFDKDWTLKKLVDHLIETPAFQIKHPSLSTPTGPLFSHGGPPELRKSTHANLNKKLIDLIPCHSDGIQITVTDSGLPFQFNLLLKLQ